MKISVITPFYEGDKYMDDYVDCMINEAHILENEGHSLEVIMVNDSPWKKLESGSDNLIKVITNEQNSGIHFSRVAGLKEATGEYVMFLDQDDTLEEGALSKLLKYATERRALVTVGNAWLEQGDGSRLRWYRTDYHKSLVGDLKTYITVGIQIISPGQCLIKRDAIPKFWVENIISKNGADDYFLWLLLLAQGVKFSYFDEGVYVHHYTAKNLSADTTVTDESTFEFIELLQECDYFNNDDAYRLHEMIVYKNQFRASSKFGKICCSLANLPIFIENVKFKRKTKTGLGFNR